MVSVRAKTSAKERASTEVAVAIAVDTLLVGRLVEVTEEVPPSRVRPRAPSDTIIQPDRPAGYGSGGYQQSRSGGRSLHERVQRSL